MDIVQEIVYAFWFEWYLFKQMSSCICNNRLRTHGSEKKHIAYTNSFSFCNAVLNCQDSLKNHLILILEGMSYRVSL